MPDPTAVTPSGALATLAERYWRFECQEMPLSAALAGAKLDDAVLFRESPLDHARRDARAGELLVELQAIDAGALAGQELATHRLLQRELGGIRAQYAVQAYLRPSIFPVAMDFSTVFWANSTAISNAADAARYVERLASIPEGLRGFRESLAAGHAAGIRYPRVVLGAAVANTNGMLGAAPEASAWFGPFKRSAVAGSEALRPHAERALTFIADELQPALREHAAFMAGPLADGARDTLTCAQGPHGKELYCVLVQHFTTTPMAPEQVHTLGLAEVARIAGEIEAIAALAGYAGNVAGYRHFLATDPQFVAPSAEALRGQIESLCKRIDRRIPAYFGHIPRITYGVDSIPEAVSANMPPAYAQPSPPDGSAPGIFWVNGLPAKCPSYLHPALALHEAWPGHLMHLALLQEARDLPTFRRHGAVKYTACVEGWALYCETLGIEMGMYETPHQRYGQLEMEMWRAVRLVVDTGIHLHDWSREKAIACMSEHLTLSPETIAGEVDRYAALPAQALGYQIGNLALRGLRKKAQAQLGERFSHRNFHTAVMTAGAVTLPVLEDLVGDWLSTQA